MSTVRIVKLTTSLQRGYCWKQCLNYSHECATNHRGFSLGMDGAGDELKCHTEQDCIDNGLDFSRDGKCYFRDPDW